MDTGPKLWRVHVPRLDSPEHYPSSTVECAFGCVSSDWAAHPVSTGEPRVYDGTVERRAPMRTERDKGVRETHKNGRNEMKNA